MRPLFFPAVFTQKILIIFCCGWGLHSFDSIQVEFPRVFPGREPQCISLIFSTSSTEPTGVAARGALSSSAGIHQCWAGFASLLLCRVLRGPHSSPCISASWDTPGWSLLSLCGLLILFSPSETKISQEVKATGVFLPHTRWDLETGKLSQPALLS